MLDYLLILLLVLLIKPQRLCVFAISFNQFVDRHNNWRTTRNLQADRICGLRYERCDDRSA
ncbi:hypothetical protein [Stieleria varia]|uniref:hypothetical protein n=1 Tax=Stieleria varia TaxID=2528005 RepID=UPI0018D21AA3|nr:hypothetical protein [Stieleria varia]